MPFKPGEGRPAFNITESQIRYAMENSKSNMSAAKWLNVSYNTYKKWAKYYGLFDQHLNQAGVGIKKGWATYRIPMENILSGKLKSKYTLSDDEIAYVGDDLIDIPIMEKVAFPIATNNASTPCKKVATYITKKNGGDGAFREAVEWILSEQGRLDSVIKSLQEKVKNQ